MKILDIKMHGSTIEEVMVGDAPGEGLEAMKAAKQFVQESYPQSKADLRRWERLPGDIIHFF